MDFVKLKDSFFQHFGKPELPINIYFAPGRVNLIGEHTDYNMGYVLPCALTYGTYLLIRKNTDNVIRLVSENFEFKAEVPLDSVNQKQGSEWVNYPLGVLTQLLEHGFEPNGMDLLYFGNIPNGAGLSSSASIEVVTAMAIDHIFSLGLDKVDLVKLSRKAENDFIGVNCGIMDQFAVGMGKKNHAIFLDCGTLDYELVPLDLGDYKIVIANTNKQRGLADSKYNERVSECQSAVKYLNKTKTINALGELTYQEFIDSKHHIPDITTRKRAKHVVSENQRVLDAVTALKRNNLRLFGKLMNASHNSLRHDYEVTGIELDTLTELARGIEGVLGSRMTGAGFGGCTVSLVHAGVIDGFIEKVGFGYKEQTGLKAEFYISEIGDGVHGVCA
jgi:galactokinase